MSLRTQYFAMVATCLLLSLSTGWSQTVRFDVPALAEGREVSNVEFQSLHPSEKLVSFAFEFAADFGFSKSDDVAAILVKLHTMEPDVTIADYCPRNLVDSEIDGPISVEQLEESSSGLGIQADTGTVWPVHANTNASIGGKNGQTLRFEKKPEQQLQVSSGLMERGTALFVKFFRTSQQPLEGMHPVRLTLRMPIQWRTGFLRFECEAVLRKDSVLNEASFSSSGKRSFLIPIFIEGDEEARIQARAIRHAESELRAATAASTERSKPNNLLEEVGRWARSEKKPDLGAQWLERVTNSVPAKSSKIDFDLPREVSIALKDYNRQKQMFRALVQAGPVESLVMQREQWSPKRSK